MNIHEYQGKDILRESGVNVPNGHVAYTVDEAVEAAKKLDSDVFVVKAQIHAGGRGNAGGVKIAKNLDDVRTYADELLGKTLVTHQTGSEGKEVKRLRIEEGCDIQNEYYVGPVRERVTSRVIRMTSASGGTEIDAVAAETTEKIFKEVVEPVVRLSGYRARGAAFNINIPDGLLGSAAKFKIV